ncbi:hypothetical protein BJ944DRAFT_286175 [Cunninghamella echinulata]|nr:hypothetical protein BJ944DRAFT_286175 [Cunninghamella echinulata]
MTSWWSFGTTTTKKEQAPITTNIAPTQPFKAMSNTFKRGVQYNMKIVIRGDVMTGKSTLFNRLQGLDYQDTYASTPQIEVTNIPWNYKDSNDIVKIEVWDVVDKAHNNNNNIKKDTGIKLEHTAATASTAAAEASTPSTNIEKPIDNKEQTASVTSDLALDASTVDVYRNSHAAILVFDITKQWTFDYVNNALLNIPDNVAILVLGNFADKCSQRVVTVEEIHATLYEHNKRRIENGTIKPNLIRYVETSLKSGLGLKYIYEYLGVPFLQLMMETLQKQLELKANDILNLLENLDKDDDVPENMHRRRGQDNFDQPSEPHLAKQHEALKQAWDNDLQEIADDHSSLAVDRDIEESLIKQHHAETPPPPTGPVEIIKREGSLVRPDTPPTVDQFDVGTLEDDWFGDDTTTTTVMPQKLKYNNDSDDDDIPGNPMVARDEDVASVEYYSEKITSPSQSHSLRKTSLEPTIIKADYNEDGEDDEDDEVINRPKYNEEDDDDEDEDINSNHPYGGSMMGYQHNSSLYNNHFYPTSTFKSELNDVWANNTGINVVQSESEDEDNQIQITAVAPTEVTGDSSNNNGSTFQSPSDFQIESFTGMGSYEEIGTNQDNPWSQGYENMDDSDNITTSNQAFYENEEKDQEDRGITHINEGVEKTNISTKDKKAKKKKKSSKSAKTRKSSSSKSP